MSPLSQPRGHAQTAPVSDPASDVTEEGHITASPRWFEQNLQRVPCATHGLSGDSAQDRGV